MKFYINSLNGSGMEYETMEEFLTELESEIRDCKDNGGTEFSVFVEADACRFMSE